MQYLIILKNILYEGESILLFVLKEFIKAGVYIFVLTLVLYYWVDTSLSTALIVALVNQVVLLILNFKEMRNRYKASYKR